MTSFPINIVVIFFDKSNSFDYFKDFETLLESPYYHEIVYMDVSKNRLTALPSILPASLRTLICYHNDLRRLPVLPDKLITLNCSNNKLKTLPQLPKSLENLYCRENYLVHIIGVKNGIKIIDCSENNIRILPEKLPETLIELNCPNNNIIELPEKLPDSLQILDCSNNQFEELPSTLPPRLRELYCNYSRISILPEIPLTMEILYCTMCDYLYFIPRRIIYCRNMREIDFYGSILDLTIDQLNYLEMMEYRMDGSSNNERKTVYDDKQNIHSSSIQKCIAENILKLMADD